MRFATLAVLCVSLVVVEPFAQPSTVDVQRIDDTRSWLKAIEPLLTADGVTNARNISTRLNTLKGQFKPVTVPPPPPPAGAVLDSLIVEPKSVVGGKPATAWVHIAAAASQDVTVLLTSSDTAKATVPPSVVIPIGAIRASAPITTLAQTATGTVTITAALGSVSKPAMLTLTGSGTTTPTDPTNPPPPPPPPPSGPSVGCQASAADGAHPYFASLRTHAGCLGAFSLRDDQQLTTYAHSGSRPRVVVYDAALDAAKVTIGTASNSLTNQVRIPIPAHGTESLLVTWEAKLGKEFAFATSGITNHKAFQITSGGNDIWIEPRTRYQLFSGGKPTNNGVAMVDIRHYGPSVGPGTVLGAGVVDGLSYGTQSVLGPMLRGFDIQPDTWTRFWVYLRFDGTWWELSYWVGDSREVAHIIDKALIKPKSGGKFDMWWIEFNTSEATVKAGRPALVAGVRNLAMLKGLQPSAVTGLLVKP